jgi:hypothetical protein
MAWAAPMRATRAYEKRILAGGWVRRLLAVIVVYK